VSQQTIRIVQCH